MKRLGIVTTSLFFVSCLCSSAVGQGTLGSSLRDATARAKPGQRLNVIIHLRNEPASSALRTGKKKRRADLARQLRSESQTSRTSVVQFLEKRGGRRIAPLWINNSVAAELDVQSVQAAARMPGVDRIDLDSVFKAPPATKAASSPAEWNLNAIKAPLMWSSGFTGNGVVVGTLDSGADINHPDLATRWRGGSNSWFDPYLQHPTSPYDATGHGTHVLGIVVGGDSGGTSIGVAPSAKWIAARIFADNGLATNSRVHEAFQWMLDPDGNPATDDAPHVVNCSWGIEEQAGQCNEEFRPDVQAFELAGIPVVCSAGNSGPGASTSVSPGNYPESLSVGNVAQDESLDFSSSRGPSACGAGVFPNIVAPGTNIFTADLTLGGTNPDPYISVTGSSFASAHVTGSVALLLGMRPQSTPEELKTALTGSAKDLGSPGADNEYGHGLVDTQAARIAVPVSLSLFSLD